MKSLNKNWLTEGHIDFEYKKYILLSYLSEVNRNFREVKLYPFLSDLVFHYQNLISVKQNKQLLYENFPKEISKADFKKLKIVYKEIIEDDEMMQALEEIIAYALPEFQKYLVEGADIYKYIEENTVISPVGVMPLRLDEGYVFLLQSHTNLTNIFEYKMTIFENSSETFRGIHLRHIDAVKKSPVSTFENEKIALIRKYKQLPNPATYLIEARVACPMDETLLPVAKRMLVKYIVQQAA